jgi:hypothetical protein
MHTAFKHFRRTLRTTNTLQRNPNPNSSLNRSQHHAAKMPLVVPGVTADNMSSDKVNEWMNKLAGKTISEEPSSETVGTCFEEYLSRTSTNLCPPWPDLLQDRAPAGDARHRARGDDDEGFQPRQAQRLCQGRRDRLACVPGLRLGVTSPEEEEGHLFSVNLVQYHTFFDILRLMACREHLLIQRPS